MATPKATRPETTSATKDEAMEAKKENMSGLLSFESV
jgi:hypothetical protein